MKKKADSPSSAHTQNRRLLGVLLLVAVAMLGVAYAFVPLYQLFCQALGIPLPSVRVGEAGENKGFAGAGISNRTVQVRFVANNAQGMPVILTPTERRLTVHLGNPILTAYTAKNPAGEAIHGVAVHTIVPLGGPSGVDVQDYLELQQCFCFEEQTYPANETVNLPLSFTLSPDLPEGIHTITFGYTLFEEMPN